MNNYLTIDELKSFMGDRWSDQFEDMAETWLIPYGSSGLRQFFKNVSLSLDDMIESGEVELIVVKSVLAEMIASSLEAQSDNLPFGDVSQMSQSAGGYSISMSGLSGTNLYLKKAQARILGLPSMTVSKLTIN